MTPFRLAARSGRRLLAAVTATGLLALAAPAAPAALAAERPEPGFVRLAHLSPDTPAVDVTLTPFSGSDPVTVEDLAYGDVSDYSAVPPGFYTAALLPADQPDAPPLLTASLEVAAGVASTVAVTGVGQERTSTVLTDDLSPPPPGQARVRLLQGASTAPSVDVAAVDGPVIAEDVAFGTATGYADVPAGTWTLRIVPTGGTAEPVTTEVTLEPASVQTLLVLDAAPGVAARPVPDEAPDVPAGAQADAVDPGQDDAADPGQDRAAPTGERGSAGLTTDVVADGEGMPQMPAGGVQAGAGSAADLLASPRPLSVTAAVVALATAAGLVTTAALLRRSSTALTGRPRGR